MSYQEILNAKSTKTLIRSKLEYGSEQILGALIEKGSHGITIG